MFDPEIIPIINRSEDSVCDARGYPGPSDDSYIGKYCQCASCRHVDGVCIDHESGSGCAACEGPVTDCDLTDYE